VLARARGRRRSDIEALVAELAPRPDVPSSVRKLPTPGSAPTPLTFAVAPPTKAAMAQPNGAAAMHEIPSPPPIRRPVIETTAPERYRVQFTIGRESHDKLRRLQDLLRREIPSGDPGLIFDRAIALLLECVEKAERGAVSKPSRPRVIRPGADRPGSTVNGRHIPNDVKRGAERRDKGQCAFVSSDGRRCTERTFLEFHHVIPCAKGGRATIDNISLRCRRHNQYEAELVFGPRLPGGKEKRRPIHPVGFTGLPGEARTPLAINP
jgi:HNH endonuclease